MARSTDPWTSHEAEASVKDVPEKAQYLLKALKKPRTDEQMIEAYRAYRKAPWASESGLRTLRVKLYRAGLIVDTGKVLKTQSNRKAIVWQAK